MGVETFSIEVTFRFNHALFRVESISRGILEESMPEHSHGHGNYEIHYISSGKGSAVIDNSFYSVLPNTLYVTGPHVIHSQTPDKEDPLTEYCIYLSLDTKNIPDSKKSPLAHFFLNQVFWYGQDNQNVLPVLNQIFHELTAQELGYLDQVRALLCQFIIALLRNYKQNVNFPTLSAQTTLSERRSLLIEQYFIYEYATLSLESLSSRIGLSPRQTQRFLREHYGKTFSQKKRESKMAAALQLLSSSQESITSISEKLGFSSVEYFSSSFRKYYKLSPQEYRRRQT